MTNQQGAPEAPKSTALDGKTELFHVPGHPLLVRAVDFNRAVLAKWGAPAQPAPTYKDSTPELHVGDSAFESWYSTYNPAHKSDKQRARDAYAAGMGDPLVMAAPAAVAGQCEDAIELLGKYKELCEEIKRGDSYHLGRIDSAISVLVQTAPQLAPAPQADSQPAKVELFNPLEGGNLETELQMAAVIALRDSQPAPVLGTIAHVGTGKTTLTGAITSALRAASTEADSVTAPASGEVAGWLPVHFNKHGFYGTPFKTEAEAKQYINQVHQSSDSVTLIARPFTWIATPPAQAADSMPKASFEQKDQ